MFQNSKPLVCSRARYVLRLALYTPAWMAGTSPAMTEPLGFLDQSLASKAYPSAYGSLTAVVV
jgi:hypothetical protein